MKKQMYNLDSRTFINALHTFNNLYATHNKDGIPIKFVNKFNQF